MTMSTTGIFFTDLMPLLISAVSFVTSASEQASGFPDKSCCFTSCTGVYTRINIDIRLKDIRDKLKHMQNLSHS